ncbi:melanocortin receptor 5-like [Hydractinia symbiolongicarpus]|uniref:melanocortin receptor 5-like n=1 Tax=Hydractinia symbiolongicarpus TaxID=13093 RepID=UPI002551146A|nr:melanocortin receptor 5-like [Hydractinia symbiolongicarpus]
MASCKNVWAPTGLSIFTATSSAIFAIIASLGNMLIVVVVIKDPLKKLRSPFLYFVVNLAVSDLIVGMVTMPISVYTHITEALVILEKYPLLRRTLHLSFFISVSASILNLMALSIDRYITITFPLKHKKYLCWKRCWAISAGIWLFSLTVPFAYIKIGFIDYLLVFTNYGIILTFIILVITYVRIYRFLRIQTAKMKKQLRITSSSVEDSHLDRCMVERKVTRVFITILAIFIATYIPATIMIYILQYCKTCDCTFRHYLRDLQFLLISLNSCLNPFIYLLRFQPFQESTERIYRSFKQRFGNLSETTDGGDRVTRNSCTQLSNLSNIAENST